MFECKLSDSVQILIIAKKKKKNFSFLYYAFLQIYLEQLFQYFFFFFCSQGNFVAVMMAILSQMTEHHYKIYIESFPYRCDLQDFLTEILMVLRNLITKNVYRDDWNDMILLQNRCKIRFFFCLSHVQTLKTISFLE